MNGHRCQYGLPCQACRRTEVMYLIAAGIAVAITLAVLVYLITALVR